MRYILGIVVLGSILEADVLDTLWRRTYPEIVGGYSVQQLPDEGFIIGGSGASLIRIDANGDTLWVKGYGGVAIFPFAGGCSVQYLSDEGFIVGTSYGVSWPEDYDVYLIRTDENGDTLWTRTYGGPKRDMGYSVQQTKDGGFIIVGYTASFGAGGYDVYLIRTDENGDTLWTRTYGGEDDDIGYSVQQTKDGGFIIVGKTASFGAGGYDVYLIKTDGNGDTLWTKTYGGEGDDIGYSVQQTKDGGFIIAGATSSFAGGYEIYLIKTNENGDTLWTRRYSVGYDDEYGYSLDQTFDGGYIIAGERWIFWGSLYADYHSMCIIRTDENGDTIWSMCPLPRDVVWEQAFAVQQTFDGGYIIAGQKDWCTYLLRLGPDVGIEEERYSDGGGLQVLDVGNKVLIKYQVDVPQSIRIEIFDKVGRMVRVLEEGYKDRGEHGVYWDKRDRYGRRVGAGIYFVRIIGKKDRREKMGVLR